MNKSQIEQLAAAIAVALATVMHNSEAVGVTEQPKVEAKSRLPKVKAGKVVATPKQSAKPKIKLEQLEKLDEKKSYALKLSNRKAEPYGLYAMPNGKIYVRSLASSHRLEKDGLRSAIGTPIWNVLEEGWKRHHAG